MANSLNQMPSLRALGGCRAAAAAFALVMAATYQAPVHAQIEVEVLTSSTKAASTASATPTPEAAEPSADEAARKIVPAPGTKLQSTENSSLGASNSVAEAPSLQFKNDQVVLKAGETTETMAVSSGAELLRMLGLQKKTAKPEGGLELEESTTNTLFDMTAVERLKGDKPTVVYRVVIDNVALPDPMIVPWIRQAKVLQERFDIAVAMLGNNKVEEGRQELMAIATDFPDSDYAIQARELLKKLDEMSKAEVAPAPVIKSEETTVTVELSANIQIGTVIVDPRDPSGNRVMINGSTYKVGDTIRGVSNHHVIGISENAVQIEVEQSGLKKTFDVPVRPTGTNNK